MKSLPLRDVVQTSNTFNQTCQNFTPGPKGVSMLPPSVKGSMESAFQTDFSNVNIHTNSESAVQMNALAYTQGSEIHFAPGQFNPSSLKGRQLIGHELTHVVQQSNNNIRPTIQSNGIGINTDPGLEKEADESGAKAASGQLVNLTAKNIPVNGIQMKCAKCEEEERKTAQLKPENGVIQRDEPEGTTGTMGTMGPSENVQPASDDEKREFVRMAMRFLEASTEHFQIAQMDADSFERIFSGWVTMNTNIESIITSLNDDTLLDTWKATFTTALRALFLRAAAQLNKPLIRLYLENMHRIPEWAWPDTSDFPQADEQQRRDFVTDFNTALNDAALFSGYTTIDQQALEYILERLQTLVSDTEVMIAQQLGNDQTVKDSVRDAYAAAVATLLSRAATTMGQSSQSLYLEYRYGSNTLIHWWADQRIAGFTTTLPQGVAPDPLTGEISFELNNVRIIIMPDGTKTGSGAETSGNSSWNLPGYSYSNGRIDAINDLDLPEFRIQTKYAPGATASSTSGYGRGTTADDIRRGNTSLGFHEGQHAHDYIRYIQNNTAPAFGGAIGQTVSQFTAARTQWNTDLTSYFTPMERASELSTDCVGTTIEDYYSSQGQASPVACP